MAAHLDRPEAPEDGLPPYRRAAAQVVAGLGGDAKRGLAPADIPGRLERHGRNELPPPPPVPAWRRFLAQFRDVLTILLLAATAVSFAAWWIERDAPVPYEALTILAIVLLNGVLGYVSARDWLLCVAVASSVLWAMELKKLVARRPAPQATSACRARRTSL